MTLDIFRWGLQGMSVALDTIKLATCLEGFVEKGLVKFIEFEKFDLKLYFPYI